ncbi:hypothetical protein M752DRAFT_276797 [Aspergillus phoenicis ATCC 13157]|uniref:Uncharacterized protein n=1 Tax=Aspergillus phoenicis ATCC 13157 TaxID=1353007 RepID=A0A370PIY5_ASPPH|nr:hypothetical protein M752DRAFT_276797 [Aspergillus phoenicis ATCC 13157]
MGIGIGGIVVVTGVEGLLRMIGWAGTQGTTVAIAGTQVANNTSNRAIIGLTDAFMRNVSLEKEADLGGGFGVADEAGLRFDTDVDRTRRNNVVER